MKNTKFLLNTLSTPFVIIMVGPPLVGKSTQIKEWMAACKNEVEVISRDAILLEHHGSNDYSEAFKSVNQKNVDKELISRIEDANAGNKNVIIDMTNLTPKRRKYNLSFFGDDYTKVAVVFPMLTAAEFKSRNEKRKIEENKFIPPMVISTMIKSFTPIADSEGFDKIIDI